MSSLFKNLKVSVRVALVCIVPLVGLTIFGGIEIFDAWTKVRAARDLLAAQQLAEKTSFVLVAIQRERGLSAGFLSSEGNSFQTELARQRIVTDRELRDFLTLLLETPLSSNMIGVVRRDVLDAVNKLPDLRKKIDTLTIDTPDVIRAFLSTTSTLLNVVGLASQLAPDFTTLSSASVYLQIIRGTNFASGERAAGMRGFATSFDPELLRRFISHISAEEAALDTLRQRSDIPAIKKDLDRALISPEHDKLVRIRELAIDSAFGRDKSAMSAEGWYELSSEWIDKLIQIESKAAADLKANAEGVAYHAILNLLAEFICTLGLIVITSALAWGAVRSITRPLAHLRSVMLSLAKGDTSHAIDETNRKDEIGEMSRALVVFRENAIERARLENAFKTDYDAKEDRHRHLNALIERFRQSVSTVLTGMGDYSRRADETAKALSSVATAAASSATSAASRSQNVALNVQSVETTVEQLANSIVDISHHAEESKRIVRMVTELCRNSHGEIENLSHAILRIGDIVALIQRIATQTNLLALNATIEAARAGEAGRGFAVVAAEVKNLAVQAARATEEIAAQIREVQESSNRSVEAMRSIASAMPQAEHLVTAIATSVCEQSNATEAISENIRSATQSTLSLTMSMGDVSGEISETSKVTESMQMISTLLSKQANGLQTEVESFLEQIRFSRAS